MGGFILQNKIFLFLFLFSVLPPTRWEYWSGWECRGFWRLQRLRTHRWIYHHTICWFRALKLSCSFCSPSLFSSSGSLSWIEKSASFIWADMFCTSSALFVIRYLLYVISVDDLFFSFLGSKFTRYLSRVCVKKNFGHLFCRKKCSPPSGWSVSGYP